MNWRNITTVYLKELKDSLRDRRTLLSTIVIPTLVMPMLTFGLGKMMTVVIAKAQEDIPTVAIIGGADSPGIVTALHHTPKLRIVARPDDWKQAISDKKIRAAIDLPANFETSLRAGAAPAVKIYHYSGELKSEHGASVAENFFTELREQTVADRLAERGLN